MIEVMKDLEIECEKATVSFIEENACRYEEPWTNFQSLFQHLHLFSCCYWGCHRKNHVLEHLAGKTVTNISVAARAMFHGYYDESLALIRNIGEIANLVNLFWADDQKLKEWMNSEDRTRIKTFRPVNIRKMLESRNRMVPFDEEHYSFLWGIIYLT